MTGILIAAAIVGGVGLFIGVFLGVAEKQFAVEVDEREEAITGVLPGNNSFVHILAHWKGVKGFGTKKEELATT